MLNARGCLARLTIKQWSVNRKDKGASDELTFNKGAAAGSARVNKTLISGPEIDAIKRAVSAMRKTHYQLTSEYDMGLAFLPNTHRRQYGMEVSDLIAEFDRQVDNLIQVYDHRVACAQADLGNLFNASDYKTADEVRAAYHAEYRLFPVPDSGHFAADAAADELEQARADLDRMNTERIDSITRDAHGRLLAAVQAMADKLAGYDPAKTGAAKGSFHKTLVTNIQDVCNVMDGLNVSQDPELTRLTHEARNLLTGHGADRLKVDAMTRETTARDAARIAADLSAMFQ